MKQSHSEKLLSRAVSTRNERLLAKLIHLCEDPMGTEKHSVKLLYNYEARKIILVQS